MSKDKPNSTAVSPTTPAAGEVAAQETKPELKPLTAAQRANLTRIAYQFGQKHGITSAAAVDQLVRNPGLLKEWADAERKDAEELAPLLEPFPDAATLKTTNDKPSI